MISLIFNLLMLLNASTVPSESDYTQVKDLKLDSYSPKGGMSISLENKTELKFSSSKSMIAIEDLNLMFIKLDEFSDSREEQDSAPPEFVINKPKGIKKINDAYDELSVDEPDFVQIVQNSIEDTKFKLDDAKNDAEKKKRIIDKLSFKEFSVDLKKACLLREQGYIIEVLVIYDDGKKEIVSSPVIKKMSDESFELVAGTSFYKSWKFWAGVLAAIAIAVILYIKFSRKMDKQDEKKLDEQ